LRKLIGLAVLVVALGIPAAAWAATLSNANGQTCDTSGTWHFVNNQTGGAPAGMLTANFSGGVTVTVQATTVLQNTQHFFVGTGPGAATLLSASTNLPGRLVLSDFSCDGGKKNPPKK
jgi:hypothetical protein